VRALRQAKGGRLKRRRKRRHATEALAKDRSCTINVTLVTLVRIAEVWRNRGQSFRHACSRQGGVGASSRPAPSSVENLTIKSAAVLADALACRWWRCSTSEDQAARTSRPKKANTRAQDHGSIELRSLTVVAGKDGAGTFRHPPALAGKRRTAGC